MVSAVVRSKPRSVSPTRVCASVRGSCRLSNRSLQMLHSRSHALEGDTTVEMPAPPVRTVREKLDLRLKHRLDRVRPLARRRAMRVVTPLLPQPNAHVD